MRGFLVEDLKEIAKLKGEFTMTKAAYKWGEDFYKNLYTTRERHLSSERYDGYIARKQGHLHKVAMVISAARGNSQVIDVAELELANDILKGAEFDMNKVFSAIGSSDENLRLDSICSVLKVQGSLTNMNLWKQMIATMSQQHYSEALASGVMAGKVRVTEKSGIKYITLVE